MTADGERIPDVYPLFVAARFGARLNETLHPRHGFALVGGTFACPERPNDARSRHVLFVRNERMRDGRILKGDLEIVPDLVIEVLTPELSALELFSRIDDDLQIGVNLLWVANPHRRTVRVYRREGTTRLFRSEDFIENEPLLPGLKMAVGDVFG